MTRVLSLKDKMSAIDLKDREYYDELSDEDRKALSTFILNRWASSVIGSTELEAYYLISTNEKFNKNFFQVPKQHDKLNWLTLTTISPGVGKQQHKWIKFKSRESDSKIIKFILAHDSFISYNDAMLLSQLNPEVEKWKEYAKQLGLLPEQIKHELGS